MNQAQKVGPRKEKQLPMVARRALADRLKRAIKEHRISYREIARRSGRRISIGTITELLGARVSDIKVTTIIGVAGALELDPQELFALVAIRRNGHGR